MKRLASILLFACALVAIAAAPVLTRTIELTFVLAPEDQSTNNTLHVQSSSNLVDWLTLTNLPATTNRLQLQLQVVPQLQFYRSCLSNAWTVSEYSTPSMLPTPLTGQGPVQMVQVLPLSK